MLRTELCLELRALFSINCRKDLHVLMNLTFFSIQSRYQLKNLIANKQMKKKSQYVVLSLKFFSLRLVNEEPSGAGRRCSKPSCGRPWVTTSELSLLRAELGPVASKDVSQAYFFCVSMMKWAMPNIGISTWSLCWSLQAFTDFKQVLTKILDRIWFISSLLKWWHKENFSAIVN